MKYFYKFLRLNSQQFKQKINVIQCYAFNINSCSIDCCGLSRKLPLCCFRGFLRSDTLIGTVNVKLQPLETKCEIHDTYDVSDNYYNKII